MTWIGSECARERGELNFGCQEVSKFAVGRDNINIPLCDYSKRLCVVTGYSPCFGAIPFPPFSGLRLGFESMGTPFWWG